MATAAAVIPFNDSQWALVCVCVCYSLVYLLFYTIIICVLWTQTISNERVEYARRCCCVRNSCETSFHTYWLLFFLFSITLFHSDDGRNDACACVCVYELVLSAICDENINERWRVCHFILYFSFVDVDIVIHSPTPVEPKNIYNFCVQIHHSPTWKLASFLWDSPLLRKITQSQRVLASIKLCLCRMAEFRQFAITKWMEKWFVLAGNTQRCARSTR